MSNWQFFPASDFPKYAEQWDKLNQQLYQSHPLLDSRFVAALLKYFGNQQVLLAVYPASAEQNGNLLLLQPRKLGIWSSFLPSQTQIAPLLCSYPKALPDLLTALPGFPVMIDVLCQDPLYTFSTGTINNIESFDHNLTINIDLAWDYNDYWQQRPKNLRENLRRYVNRLKKNSLDYQLKIFSNTNELKNALQRYGEIESAGWKGDAGTAIHVSNIQGQFYNDTLNAFATTEQAEIIELHINGQLAASRIIILNSEMLIILKTSFDESFSYYSPSHIMLKLLIEREFSLKRVQHIEFYTNARPDQLSWKTEQRNIKHLTIYRSSNIQHMIKSLSRIIAKLANRQ